MSLLLKLEVTCALLTHWAAVAAAQVTVIKAGRLVAPETGTVSENQLIIIEGERIEAVGAELEIPEGANVIDLSHATVLPGLFDAHTHLCLNMQRQWDGGDYLVNSLNWRAGMRALTGVVHAREMLDAGFTTVRDVGNAGDYAAVDLARAIAWGMVPGPTIVAAGRIITPFGGQFAKPAPKHVLDNPEYLFADTRDELQKAVRENIYYGAHLIKLIVDDQPYVYTAEEIRFVVVEAGKAGRRVAAHCVTRQGARNAAAAGVASIEHGWQLGEEEFALMKQNNVALVGTDPTLKHLEALGRPAEQARHDYEQKVERLRRAHQAGITLVFGTDLMSGLPGETRGTLAVGYVDSFVEAGVPNEDILRALTTHAARLLGVERERGFIAPGFYADLIAVPDNPLEDIQTLKRVLFIMRHGRIHRRTP